MAVPMENQSGAPAPSSGDPIPSKSHFHIVLALIVIPFVAGAVGWTLAILDVLRGYANRAQLRWMSLLVGLVVVDSLVIMGLIWTAANKDEMKRLKEGPAAPKSYVGIRFQPDDAAAPPIVETTAVGHAAEKAGIRSGDRILQIDGSPVRTQQETTQLLSRGEPGVPRKLRIRREGAELDLEIVPGPYPRFGLFQVVYREGEREWHSGLTAWVPALLFAVLAWAVGWWRFGDRGKLWLGVLICLGGAELLGLVVDRIVEGALGGVTVGGLLITMTVSGSALLGLGLLVRRIFPDPRAEAAPEPRPPVVKTYFQGVFYLITGSLRIGFLLLMVDVLWFEARGSSNPIQQLVSVTELGVGGSLLLILVTVLLAPLGEELVFRGFLLPRLQAQKGAAWAVGVSAVFFALLHSQYGVYIPLIILYGVVLGWARVRSGGLKAPILLHLSINALATTVMLVGG